MSKFKLTQTAAEVQDILNNFNSLKSDAEGNLTASKNLGVDGKLKLKSLVSASNPDGDITKELGGGGSSGGTPRHGYMVDIIDSCYYIAYTTKDYNLQIGETTNEISDFLTNDNYKELRSNGWHPVAGYDTNAKPVIRLQINNGEFILWKYNTSDHSYNRGTLSYTRFSITKLF